MYIGIGKNSKLRVFDEDAFCVACEKCRTGTDEEKEMFFFLVKDSKSMEEFSERLVEWFYSGDWIYEEE